MIKKNFVNNIYIFKSSNKLKKNGRYPFNSNFIRKITFKNRINVNLFGDNIYKESLK